MLHSLVDSARAAICIGQRNYLHDSGRIFEEF